ncbi:septin-5-like isoform X4 [Acanthochromis polyacanthus]|uniref:septin-5-like isoform X4 n=1 Tax=Acanthochromis polyacanthus TaxID=80966 RepID=UPI00223467B3|nr:septin-5-like isoform X4 [Acanthochromis polyacanthus]
MATFSNVSSKYKDIISKSRELCSGSPSIYQLKPKKETFGTLTKLTVGEGNVKKINKTILLVGETGTGKSSLINALVNHTMGVKWKDEVWFKIVEEEKRSQTESQTSDVIVYQVFGFEGKTLPYSLTIIDTPGFGDTRGEERDLTINQRLLDLFRSADGVHEVNAVGLVMKASENRVSDRLKYIFDSMMSLFGKNIEKNIVALITHSNGTNPEYVLQALEASEIKCTRDEDNDPVYFLFDNCLDKQRTKREKFGLEHAWKVTERGMSEFMTFLEETGPQKLNTTVEVMKERERLTACFQNLQERIKSIDEKQKAIEQNEEVLKKHEEEMKKNKEFTVEVDETYKDKKPIKGGMWGLVFYDGAVTCKVCKENCHYPGCTKAWYPGHCEIMKDGRCTSCTRKCRVEDHVKEEWIYVTKTRRVTKTLEDVKQKYEKNLVESEKKFSLLENLKTEMNQQETDKTRFLEKAYHHVVKLNQIALKAHSGSTSVQLDFLIEKMKEKGDTEKVHMLEEMKRKQKEGNKGAVQSVWDKMRSAGKE